MIRRILFPAALAFIFGSCGPSPDALAAREAEAAPKPCDVAGATTVLSAWRATGLVASMDVTAQGMAIVLDEAKLEERPDGTMLKIVEAADCAVAGPTGHLSQIEVSLSDGTRMADYSAVSLANLRARSTLTNQ